MKNDNLLIIATRKSPLAMWQTLHTKRKILDEFPHINVKILSIVTTGDKLKGKLTEFGGKGLFVKELQQALLRLLKKDLNSVEMLSQCIRTLDAG